MILSIEQIREAEVYVSAVSVIRKVQNGTVSSYGPQPYPPLNG
jgi:hypothetical protein